MFIAVNDNGDTRNLFTMQKEELLRLKGESFFCPLCRYPVILKNGLKIRPHFAHKNSNRLCKGESVNHLLAKENLFNFFHSKKMNVVLERVYSTINQKADLALTIGKKEYVIEYQQSKISRWELSQRISGYKKLSLEQIWLVGGNTCKRKYNYYTMSPFIIELLSESKQSMIRKYCPQSNSLHVLHSILFLHSTKIIASEMIYSLDKSSISVFFSLTLKKEYKWEQFFKTIVADKRNILTYFQSNQHFVFQLYENAINLVSNTYIGLPLIHNRYFQSSCVIWQGYIVIFFMQNCHFSVTELSNYIFLLINQEKIKMTFIDKTVIEQAIEEYLYILEKLQLIKFCGDKYVFLKKGEIIEENRVIQLVKEYYS